MILPKDRSLIDEALEEGIAFGLRNGFKHTDDPPTDQTLLYVAECLEREIWNALDRRFSISDPPE